MLTLIVFTGTINPSVCSVQQNTSAYERMTSPVSDLFVAERPELNKNLFTHAGFYVGFADLRAHSQLKWGALAPDS